MQRPSAARRWVPRWMLTIYVKNDIPARVLRKIKEELDG
jgi:hypothetical protein